MPRRVAKGVTKRAPKPRIRDPEAGRTLLGMPLRTRWHKGLLLERLWDSRDDAVLFPPKSYGWGWSLNFAYPLIKTKPLWARVLAFVVCLTLLLLVLWALTSLALIIYYVLEAWLLPSQTTAPIVFELTS
jgi:hypothetical protein